ncbi:CDPK-related kinase [Corchorus olitorius]|uniref:CDPK-related kinase n=1 Tax=Corchorus olitorius TaxID=93759 RepID=A0A1R3KQC7_9ROSI|nr:CDPK-related kinase [Corchorus olitorius]
MDQNATFVKNTKNKHQFFNFFSKTKIKLAFSPRTPRTPQEHSNTTRKPTTAGHQHCRQPPPPATTAGHFSVCDFLA